MGLTGTLKSTQDKVIAFLAPPAAADTKGVTTTATPATEPTGVNALAIWLAGAFALASAVLAFIGVKDGELDRVLRNKPEDSILVFTLLGACVAMAMIARAVNPSTKLRFGLAVALTATGAIATAMFIADDSDDRTAIIIGAVVIVGVITTVTWKSLASLEVTLLAASLVLFSIGMFGAFKLGVDSKATKDRPNIAASFTVKEGVPTITVSVNARGLRNDEYILARLDGKSEAARVRDDECGNDCEKLHAFRVGGDASGAVDRSVEVAITPGRYHEVRVTAFICDSPKKKLPVEDFDKCEPDAFKTSLVDLRLPDAAVRPQISVAWKTVDTGGADLEATTSMSDLANDLVVVTRVVGLKADGTTMPLAQSVIAGTNDGAANFVLPVAIAAGVTQVCVSAEAILSTKAAAALDDDNPCATPKAHRASVVVPVPKP